MMEAQRQEAEQVDQTDKLPLALTAKDLASLVSNGVFALVGETQHAAGKHILARG